MQEHTQYLRSFERKESLAIVSQIPPCAELRGFVSPAPHHHQPKLWVRGHGFVAAKSTRGAGGAAGDVESPSPGVGTRLRSRDMKNILHRGELDLSRDLRLGVRNFVAVQHIENQLCAPASMRIGPAKS